MGKGPRDGGEVVRGTWKELRCVVYMSQLSTMNVIAVQYKHELKEKKWNENRNRGSREGVKGEGGEGRSILQTCANKNILKVNKYWRLV